MERATVFTHNQHAKSVSVKRTNKTWEAAMRLKGSIVVIDKSILD